MIFIFSKQFFESFGLCTYWLPHIWWWRLVRKPNQVELNLTWPFVVNEDPYLDDHMMKKNAITVVISTPGGRSRTWSSGNSEVARVFGEKTVSNYTFGCYTHTHTLTRTCTQAQTYILLYVGTYELATGYDTTVWLTNYADRRRVVAVIAFRTPVIIIITGSCSDVGRKL